jgi:hypothetical protein
VIRTLVSSPGQPSQVTVHAGPAAELAALAAEYAAGQRGQVPGTQPCHFEALAARLLNGTIADSVGSVEFWRDHPDGTPFHGPDGYRPDIGRPGVVLDDRFEGADAGVDDR